MKRQFYLIVLMLMLGAILLLSVACGDGGDDPDGDSSDWEDGDVDRVDVWDPGDSPDGDDCGYSGGYGSDCQPEGEGVDCTRNPCVYGVCRTVNGKGVCDCSTGYTGRFCDACAESYVARNLECVPE